MVIFPIFEYLTLYFTSNNSAYENLDEIERVFWKSLRPTMDPPVYGADVVVSLSDS
jgi:hypothetical protein